jgi:hypothetical protein
MKPKGRSSYPKIKKETEEDQSVYSCECAEKHQPNIPQKGSIPLVDPGLIHQDRMDGGEEKKGDPE